VHGIADRESPLTRGTKIRSASFRSPSPINYIFMVLFKPILEPCA
jgi:hypothetical protein